MEERARADGEGEDAGRRKPDGGIGGPESGHAGPDGREGGRGAGAADGGVQVDVEGAPPACAGVVLVHVEMGVEGVGLEFLGGVPCPDERLGIGVWGDDWVLVWGWGWGWGRGRVPERAGVADQIDGRRVGAFGVGEGRGGGPQGGDHAEVHPSGEGGSGEELGLVVAGGGGADRDEGLLVAERVAVDDEHERGLHHLAGADGRPAAGGAGVAVDREGQEEVVRGGGLVAVHLHAHAEVDLRGAAMSAVLCRFGGCEGEERDENEVGEPAHVWWWW